MPDSADHKPPIDVAAAVLTDPTGRVLLACRPPHAAWAGHWEFPGGKFEPGEDGRACLARELHEELGIDVETVFPWITVVYAYPERTVRLHFFRVTRWRGEPHGREGHVLSWQRPEAVRVAPLLPANAPILARLTLPSLYAITQAERHGVDAFLPRLDAALARGVRLIQVREKDLPPERLAAFAGEVVARAHARGARVLVNGDIGLALSVGADGVHLTARQLATLDARPPLALCAASCHDRRELERATVLDCDFVVLSPVLPTASHPEAKGLGWDAFARLVANYPLPVYALGGMKRELLETAMSHGAHGIAMLSGVWESV